MNIVFKSGDYVSVPMTENLFWNRVGNLRNAMLTAEDFEFRLLYFHKLQELMRFVQQGSVLPVSKQEMLDKGLRTVTTRFVF